MSTDNCTADDKSTEPRTEPGSGDSRPLPEWHHEINQGQPSPPPEHKYQIDLTKQVPVELRNYATKSWFAFCCIQLSSPLKYREPAPEKLSWDQEIFLLRQTEVAMAEALPVLRELIQAMEGTAKC